MGATKLHYVTARQAITDLLYRYCRAMDRMDLEQGYALWHGDGVADYGPFFQGTGRGFIDFVYQAHAAMVSHSHQVSNIIIEFASPVQATSEAYVTAALRTRQGERQMQTTTRGRYLDEWTFKDRRWGIDRRVYVHDLDETHEVKGVLLNGTGARDRSDPSYRFVRRSSPLEPWRGPSPETADGEHIHFLGSSQDA
jgi:hypothetical protein